MLVANQNSTKNSLDKEPWLKQHSNAQDDPPHQPDLRPQTTIAPPMIKSSFEIKGSFRINWWTFKIKGSFKRGDFSRSKDFWEVMNFKIKGSFMCLVCMFLWVYTNPDLYHSLFFCSCWQLSWVTHDSCRRKAQSCDGKMLCSETAELLIFWFDEIQNCTWITLPAFADEFWIAGGFVNTMNLPGCNWGCSSLVRHSHPNPWKFIIMLGCYVNC